MDVLTLTAEGIEEHNYTLYSGKSVDELVAIRKKVASDVGARVALAKATLKLNKPINSGLHKVLKENAPKFLEWLPVVETSEKVKFLNSKGEIEEKVVYSYVPTRNIGEEFEGRGVTDEQALSFIDIEAEDSELTPRELIAKYAISENLYTLKTAIQANHLNEIELEFRRAKVQTAMKQIKLAVLDSLAVRVKTEKTRAFMKSTSGWLKSEGLETLFGVKN